LKQFLSENETLKTGSIFIYEEGSILKRITALGGTDQGCLLTFTIGLMREIWLRA
jgi:hypothetical protein